MNHKHSSMLHAIFAHPTSANLDPKQVYAALEELGATVSHGGHGQVIIKLGGHTHGFHHTHHSLLKDQVGELRQFLTQAGMGPEQLPPL
jgi:hypothetical protein